MKMQAALNMHSITSDHIYSESKWPYAWLHIRKCQIILTNKNEIMFTAYCLYIISSHRGQRSNSKWENIVQYSS